MGMESLGYGDGEGRRGGRQCAMRGLVYGLGMHRPSPSMSRARSFFALLGLVLLGACASGPGVGRFGSDGPEPNPPPDLIKVPDAEPKLEPIRPGGPNKPYDVFGRSYVPIVQDQPFTERGLASWYGRKFNGKPTASGELYNMYGMTAAHPTLPIPSYARIRNPANGREVVVRINDRGPFHSTRIVDLSYTAALKLDLLKGVAPVELQRITSEDIRTGAWRRGSAQTQWAGAEAPPVVAAVPVSPPSPPAPLPVAAASLPASDAATVVEGASPANGDALPTMAVTAPESASSTPTPVADGPTARAYTGPARGWWVQIGAFRAHDGAESFMHRVSAELDWLSPLLAIFNDASVYRLQAGPYPSREHAKAAAEQVRDGLKLVPLIVERR